MQASEISIQVPDTADGRRAKEIFAVSLYAEGVLSQSQAAKLIEHTIQEFQSLLRSRGISHLGHKEDEINAQLLDVLEHDDE